MANDFYNIDIHYRNNTDMSAQSEMAVNPHSNPKTTIVNDNIFDKNKIDHIRLNALDSTILEEESYRNLDDEVLKTEYRISKLTDELKNIEKEISQAQNINDYQKIDTLNTAKYSIENKLSQLHKSYKNSDVITHISEDLSNILTIKPSGLFNSIKIFINHIQQNILRKISKSVNSGADIKDALNKLETLNKNVDELVTMQAPYGEAEDRYEQLTDYLNRANIIHYNISKTIGTPTFFDTISSIDKEKLKQAQKEKSNFGNMTKRKNIQ